MVPDAKIRETLQFMERSPDERITRSIGGEICQRQGVKAMMAGEIAALGSNYVVTLNALDCVSGDTLASRQVEATSKEEVLGALGKGVTAMRKDLGESLASVEQYDAPIEQATTSSLEALHSFALGIEERAKGGDIPSIPFFERAIEQDPSFVMAHARLGTVLSNTGVAAKAAEHLSRAYELRDRVSESERIYVTAAYHNIVTLQLEKSLEAYELWKRTYPREWTPYNNNAVMFALLGQWEQSLENGLEAIRRAPEHIFPYTNTAYAYFQLDRPDEAVIVLQEALDRGLEDMYTHWLLAEVAHLEGDDAARDEHLAWADGTPDQAYSRGASARFAVEEGKWGQADGLYVSTSEYLERAEQPELVGAIGVDRAAHQLFLGYEAYAVETTNAALALSRSDTSVGYGAMVLALAGQTRQAQPLIAELEERFPTGTIATTILVPAATAAIAISEGEPEKAIEALEASRVYEKAYLLVPYLRGLAYLEQGDGESAAAEFTHSIDRRALWPIWAFNGISRLGLARAQLMSGDADAARRTYQDLLEQWAEADEGIPVVETARAEYEALR